MTAGERFEQYVLPEIPVLARVARVLTRHDADADDLVQDTLIRAFRAIDSFDGRHPRAWLLVILRNTHINRVRQRRPQPVPDADGGFERFGRLPASDRADASVDEQFHHEVEAALRSLPDHFREAVELVDVGGLSYAEAADALGVPVGTVMSRLHRGRTRMRDRLERVGVVARRGS